MTKFYLSIFFLLIGFFSFQASCEDEAVITLTLENFDKVIEENPLILVEFYAPWCTHCKKLAPEYEKAAEILKEYNLPLAKIDADAEPHRPLAQRYGVRGFPTLKLFRSGEALEFKGERSADGIVSYMKRQASPAVRTLKSEDVEEFVASEKVVVVGFFDNREGEKYSTFTSVANSLREKFSFGEVVGNSEVNKKYGVTSTPTVILFKKFDEGKVELKKEDFDKLEHFILSNSVPSIDEIGPENYRVYMDAKLPVAYLFVDLTVEGQKDQYLEVVKDSIKASKGVVNWVYIDWSKYARHSERLGLSGKTFPALAIEDMETGKHYAFDENLPLTVENVSPWVKKYLDKELPPTIKSEAIPATNDGPVKIVVANSFDQIVLDETKDVLVEFYAPWCGHCKKLAPIYDELGEKFKSVPNVVIAKIDATANDIDPGFGIRGFPTLKLFRANEKKNPLDYNGDRTLEDMIKFLQQHASSPIDLPSSAKDEL